MSSALLIPFFPLLAFGLILLLGRRAPGKGAYLAVGGMAASLLCSLWVLAGLLRGKGGLAGQYLWILTADTTVKVGVTLDPLAGVMLLVVSLVGLLIFIYSIGYMQGDPRYPRFFAYLSLFGASMLGLVLANNLFGIYVCWELVGLCSYFLIGFWFERPAAARAAKKAFLVTRFGDSAMLVGLLFLIFKTGTTELPVLFAKINAGLVPGSVLTIASLLIFCGAMGKSAQFPLHIWLPDAMEGPTPVSALIHAATMVAAGVYLVARCFPLFEGSHPALLVVTYIGGFTALFAASIALVTNDIKRVLAYSTISQLGYMMMALGLGGLSAGIFHLATHAVFKALLFLAAGSVIHSAGVQDIMQMGGLRAKMPVTSLTFLIGGLALAGIPPLSGFFSKDEILLKAFEGNKIAFVMGAAAALMTAFYMARTYILAFLGSPRREMHAHESPPVMTLPLLILSGLAIAVGFLGFPRANGTYFHHFLERSHNVAIHNWLPEISLMVASVLLASASILVGAAFYYWRCLSTENARRRLWPLYVALKNKWWMDEAWNYALILPSFLVQRAFALFDLKIVDGLVNLVGIVTIALTHMGKFFDLIVVDGLVNLVGWLTKQAGATGRYFQTGVVQNYLLFVFIGALLLFLFALR
jgi:NADH-quinone oxidoreductase subunit L